MIQRDGYIYFFFWYKKNRNNERKMLVRFRNKTLEVENVKCFVPTQTCYEKDVATVVMEGYAKKIVMKREVNTIVITDNPEDIQTV